MVDRASRPRTTSAGIVVKLRYPFEVDGRIVSELNMRRPTLEDARAAAWVPGGVAKVVALVSVLAALPLSVIDEIDGGDFDRIAGVVGDLLRALAETEALDSRRTLH